MRKARFACLGLLVAASGCGGGDDPVDPGPIDPGVDPACTGFEQAIDSADPLPIHTPRWAFEPWISKDISDGPDTYAFVDGFQSRDIPVGVVVLDSPWETNYNTFIPNPDRYPNFEQMVTDLRERGVRTVLWTTQMVNVSSFDLESTGDIYPGPAENYQEGFDCGFYVNEGTNYGWWKGLGAAVDFNHPEGRAWWHRQQDALLEMGVAGWKLDFGESYITTNDIDTFTGRIDLQQYSEDYYRDFYAYGGAKLEGLDEFTTMVRPYDESYQFEGRFFARPEHAPVAWVGDNRRDWIGLVDALDHLFRSAAAGYVVIGSDIGGYLDVDDQDVSEQVPWNGLAFDRWVAQGALTPFMQLHGRDNITPWTTPDGTEETVEIYRYWSKLHHELVPFWYSLAEQAYADGGTIMIPVGDEASWPGDYRYRLGEAFLVAPILDETGIRDVELPAGDDWYDWWQPDADALPGGQTLAAFDVGDRLRIPFFVRRGAIVPLADATETTGLGSEASRSLRTWLVYPDDASTSFTLVDDDESPTTLEAVNAAGTITIDLSRAPTATILRVRTDTAITGATVDGTALPSHADRAAFDAATTGTFVEGRFTWVKVDSDDGAQSVVLTSD